MIQERILLAPGCSGTEMLRTLALYQVPSFGLRILSAAELAELSLTRSAVQMPGTYLSSRERTVILYGIMRKTAYFSAATYQDAEKVSSALTTLCGLITAHEGETLAEKLPEGPFTQKNAALLQIYHGYRETLRKKNLYDGIDLLRYALANAKPMQAEFLSVYEYPLTPLEQALLSHLSGGTCQVQSVETIFGRAVPDVPKIEGITRGYGKSNEIEHIFAVMQQGRMPYDTCTIAVTAAGEYASQIFDFAVRHSIPVTFECGLPITDTCPAQLLHLWSAWNGTGYNGQDALRMLLRSGAMNQNALFEALEPAGFTWSMYDPLIQTAGYLRISDNALQNRRHLEAYAAEYGRDEAGKVMVAVLQALAAELERGCAGFIERYAALRKDPQHAALDKAAATYIAKMIRIWETYGGGEIPADVIPVILGKTVCIESACSGAVHVTELRKLPAVMRPNLFIAGLSASLFPGTPSENSVVLDRDLELFSADAVILPTSGQRVTDRQKCLELMLQLGTALGSRIFLSYADYNLPELKEENPASCLYAFSQDPARDAGPADYFAHVTDSVSVLGRAYAEGVEVLPEPVPVQRTPYPADEILAGSYSPTAIEKWFECPRKFYLRTILRLKEENEDDPLEVISAADLGTLIHDRLEQLGKQPAGTYDLRKDGAAAFDRFLACRPPIKKTEAALEKESFLNMLETAVEMHAGNTIVKTEANVAAVHPSGVRLHGRYDVLVQTADGSYLLVDYKTGRRITHDADDPLTCLQLLLYAYMLEQNGIRVQYCEYRYLRYGKAVRVQLDDANRAALDGWMEQFADALKNGSYGPLADQNQIRETCRYCSFRTVCRTLEGTGDEDDA